MNGWALTIANKSYDNWPGLLSNVQAAERPGQHCIPPLTCHCEGCDRYQQSLREAERFGLRMGPP
jgi:hypothetical protein